MIEQTRNKSRSVIPEILSFERLDKIIVAVVFLQSLLIAWYLFLILDGFETTLLFRFLQGVAILFAVIVPVYVLLDGCQDLSITDGFFIPLALYVVMFPLFNSLIQHAVLFLDPGILIPGLAGGLGFGLIGLGAYHFPRDLIKSFAVVTAGITIIFISTPMVLAGFLYVLTGNLGPLSPMFL